MAMYLKNKTRILTLRLSDEDMSVLLAMSKEYGVTVSTLVRDLIDKYKKEGIVYGYTKTDRDNII